MLIALTRAVSPRLAECELTFLEREPIDAGKAAAQHQEYERCLKSLGLHVISMPAEPHMPDGVFVEDPAIVLDEIAVICRPGAESRRGETESIARALSAFRELKCIREPGTIEGGDVMRVGRTLYAGLSRRTNRQGIEQLSSLVGPFGYCVHAVEVFGSLHLKSAICWLGDRALVNQQWIAAVDLPMLEVPPEEPAAANVLRIGDTVLMPASFPATRELLEHSGYRVMTVDISELQKAEAGVTCSCLIVE
jgi:dimethylargininase